MDDPQKSPHGPGISILVGLYEDADVVIRERERYPATFETRMVNGDWTWWKWMLVYCLIIVN